MDLLKIVSQAGRPAASAPPQFVAGAVCLRCEVCCHFPEADSFLRPYFTKQEISRAVEWGLDAKYFPDKAGSHIALVPHPAGDGYLCPAFDSAAGRCRIYENRPLDCRLYPFALMWDPAHERVLLGWDSKCPFMRDAVPAAIATHAERVLAWLDSEEVGETLAAHPRLIGRFQEDVVVLREVPFLTARLRAMRSRQTETGLAPLTSADASRFTQSLRRSALLDDTAPAAYAFAYHAIWTSLLSYGWMERNDTWYLFARSPDGWFMPVLPIGAAPVERAAREAFDLMREWNGPSAVNRIENVPGRCYETLTRAGFTLRRSAGDYLYDAAALAVLKGDRHKSQRALCNRVEREHRVAVSPYGEGDRIACAALYERWATQKTMSGTLEPFGRLLLEDGRAAHARVLAEAPALGLDGFVARCGGAVVAYTFGYWLTPRTFCVLLEVADRTIPGLAQYVFRDTCRWALARGASFINALDDAGLAGLRAAKAAYHPIAVLDNWVATRPA